MAESLRKPTSITGGCLCGSIRYRVDFPPSHNFSSACQTCQCTQCRRTTGSLFVATHTIPSSALRFTSTRTQTAESPKRYRATPDAHRCFCGTCGSFLYWQSKQEELDLAVGCIDPMFLFGEERGVEGGKRDEGFGRALAGARTHVWCANEIAGVTDAMLTGTKLERDSEYGVVLAKN